MKKIQHKVADVYSMEMWHCNLIFVREWSSQGVVRRQMKEKNGIVAIRDYFCNLFFVEKWSNSTSGVVILPVGRAIM